MRNPKWALHWAIRQAVGVLLLGGLAAGVPLCSTQAQYYPTLGWQRFYGLDGTDSPTDLLRLPNGTLVLANNHYDDAGCATAQLIGIGPAGEHLWQRDLGCGLVHDLCLSSDQQHFYYAGTTPQHLLHPEPNANNEGQDYWIGKLSPTGSLLWNKALGGTGRDQAFAIAPDADQGILVAGSSWSKDYEVPAGSGKLNNAWILKLDAYGQILHSFCLGGTKNDWITAATRTADGGHLLLGYTTSEDLDNSRSRTNGDAWVIKLDATGKTSWQRVLKEPYEDELCALVANSYNVLAAVGSSFNSQDSRQFWFVRLDETGNLQTDKKWGGKGIEQLTGLALCADGGYILCGYSHYYDLENSYIKGQQDLWVIRTDAQGEILWQETYGGPDLEGARAIVATENNYYVLGQKHNTFDASAPSRGMDAWLLKIEEQPCSQLVARFETNLAKPSIPAGASVRFINQSQQADRYHWYFSDGSESTEVSPTKTFAQPGSYTVRLTAYRNRSCEKTYLYPTPIVVK